jgi:hypothetical protein
MRNMSPKNLRFFVGRGIPVCPHSAFMDRMLAWNPGGAEER